MTERLGDTNGSPATETIRVGVGGAAHEIELPAGYCGHATYGPGQLCQRGASRGAPQRPAVRTTVGIDADPGAMRPWALSWRVELAPRDRIPAAFVEQFRCAGN